MRQRVEWRHRLRLTLRRLIAAGVWVIAVRAISAAPGNGPAHAAAVRISVLSLFHPTEMIVAPVPGSTVELIPGSEPVSIHEGESVQVSLDGRRLNISIAHGASTLRADALEIRRTGPFLLEVPGRLRRRYVGSLTIQPHGLSIEAVVTMPLETAVASIVAAESPPDAPMEARKAQAVATRSFLIARESGHVGFDFCDTTHCQFLRSPPEKNSLAARAAAATRGLVLTWHDAVSAQEEPVAAMYARSCGGETRSLRAIGVQAGGYPYYAVRCAYCRRHPEVWQRQFGGANAPRTERDRLLFNRIHGWGAFPGLADKSSSSSAGERTIEGRGVGHGIGLCQLGAADMARHGASFDRILAHYYPNTQIREVTAQTMMP
jgi:stage II sporulation protein D